MSVAEPFDMAEPRRFGLRKIAADHGATLHRGALEGVDVDRALVSVRGGPSLTYDALLVAVGWWVLATNTVLTASYVGSRGHNILVIQQANPGDPALCLSVSRPDQVAPGSPTCTSV